MTTKYHLLKVFSILAVLAMVFSNIQPAAVQAQSGDGLKRQVNAESGRVSFISPASGRSLSAARALQTSIRPQDPAMALAAKYAPEFGLQDAERNLTAMASDRSDDGRLTVRFQQNHEDVPVMGGELIVNTNDNGDLYSISGEVSPGLSISTQPVITSEQAREIALQAMAVWYEKTPEYFVSTEPELWIYDESLLQPSTRPVELTWRMEVTPKDASIPVRELVLVGAQRGNISLHFNQVDTTWTSSAKSGTAPGLTQQPAGGPRMDGRSIPAAGLPDSQVVLRRAEEGAGATWYVATNGSNANDCATPLTPCATLNVALSKAATAGDMIKVAAGTYTDQIAVWASNQVIYLVVLIDKSIAISGGWDAGFTMQDGETIIDGAGSRTVIRIVNTGNTPVVNLERLTIRNGYGFFEMPGGGIENYGNLTINQSEVLNNKIAYRCCVSGVGGSGIANYGTLFLKNSTVSSNSILDGIGGGAILNGGTLSIENSTISYNSGSAIYNSSLGSSSINNSTIAYNNLGLENNKSLTLSNSIVARNGKDCQGTVTSLGYNLVGNGSGCTISNAGGDLIGAGISIDPQLGPLQENGGFTLTQALSVDSPAVDAGNPATCLLKDQRGVGRPVGSKCDMGAFEGTLSWTPAYLVETYSSVNTSMLRKFFLCDETDPGCVAGDQHARAAHKYAIGTYEFYKSKFSRNSIDNQGMVITSNVHYCEYDYYYGHDRCPYDNASWNGEEMVFGDAHGYPLADDIVAHELTHGVTQYESNLFYYYQSGAINESFSDLWGEYYDQTNGIGNDAAAVKWIIGEDVSGYPIPSGFSVPAMRSMSNPPALKDPDKMSSTYYYEGFSDNGGVHWNSGINNKAVYLMVNGGSFNGKVVTAIGWEKVGVIYYQVNTSLLTSGADYSDLYYAVQQACNSLIGYKGIAAADCTEVKDAIDAVEMNSQPATNFNTDAPLCPPTGTFDKMVFSDDLENGTGNWTLETNGTAYGWQLDSPYGQYAQSGQHFLYADDYPQVVGTPTDARATLAPFVAPKNGYLHFAHAYEFQADYIPSNPGPNFNDGGVLEYSTDDGATWNDAGWLIEYNTYNGKIMGAPVNGVYLNPLYNRAGFAGASHGYISTRVSLNALAGQTVSFRWRMGLDSARSAWGWWVDNIKVYSCRVPMFADVPFSHPYNKDIEILYANGLTGGCGTNPLRFCPDQIMDRAMAAVFMVRGAYGAGYVPNPTAYVFRDNWSKAPYARAWAEAMRETNLTTGCQASPPLYCPMTRLNREQAVIFGLKMKYGTYYQPPPATGTVFADMTNPNYYATAWAEKAYADGLITDCGTLNGKPKFCPTVLVTRGLGAYIIVRAKGLTMP